MLFDISLQIYIIMYYLLLTIFLLSYNNDKILYYSNKDNSILNNDSKFIHS